MQHKQWLITGASSGLGFLLVKKLLERGDHVFATVRNNDTLVSLKADYPNSLCVLTMELTDVTSIREAVDNAFSRSPIDVVVSNAGYGLFGVVEGLTDRQIERQLQTNLVGSIQLIRASLPHLRQQGGGRFVQVSSEGGQVAYPNFSLYHASKWGIEGFVEAVSQEVDDFNIQFLIAEPGPTETNFAQGLDVSPLPNDYKSSEAGRFYNSLMSGDFQIKGDANRTIDAFIQTIDLPTMPKRIALGSTAYENITKTLQSRLDEITQQKTIAYSADKF